MLSSPEDILGNAVVEASGGAAVVVPCSVAQLIALIRRASLVIAGDTGPLHLAAALERPVVALFGPTDPARNGPYGTRFAGVAPSLRAGRTTRRHAETEEGLMQITVDEVVAAAFDLLQPDSGKVRAVSERTQWQRIARRIRVPLGFVFAAVFLWLARPTWQTMLASLVLVVPGVWLRAYAAGYVRKNAELTRTGPYAHTRNPLYLGSMMIAFGFAVAAGSWIIFVALAVAVCGDLSADDPLGGGVSARALCGLRRVREEGAPAAAAADRRADDATPPGRFSPELYLHHREYNASMGAIAIYAALAARLLFLKR